MPKLVPFKEKYGYNVDDLIYAPKKGWKFPRKKRYLSTKENSRAWKKEMRKGALERVGAGNLKCVRCGNLNYDFLEINHKNLDGNKERKIDDCWTFYRKIVQKERGIEDLEILCKICNWAHYMEHKYKVKVKIELR